MGLLFLDPLVLVAIVVILVGCWVVWRGTLRSWFGRPGGWTMLVWPLPLVLVVTPLVVGPLRGALALLLDAGGRELSDTADALVFAGLYLVPLVGLTVWPPRWLLPGWARARLTAPVRAAGAASAASAVVAVHDGSTAVVVPACLGRRGHGSRARWTWRVDAVAGVLTVADGLVRFRPDPPAGTTFPAADVSGSDGTGRPAGPTDAAGPPASEVVPERSATRTGATWGRRYLEADLAAVDRVRIHARRPWANDGALTLVSEARPPAHLWVSDVARLQQALTSARG